MLGGVCALQANAVCLGSLGHYNELAGHNEEPILQHTNKHTQPYTQADASEKSKKQRSLWEQQKGKQCGTKQENILRCLSVL